MPTRRTGRRCPASALVPGIGTHVDVDLKKYMDTNENPKAQTAQVGTNPHNVAAISYPGYVAPEGPGGRSTRLQTLATPTRPPRTLARFEEGLRASGNFIICGSPGAGAESTDQYKIPEGHVYESSAPEGDAVQGLGPDSEYGTNPKKLSGITHLSGDTTDSENYKIPGEDYVRNTGHPFKQAADILGTPFLNHDTYFDEGTRTSQDFSNIIAGGKQTTDDEWAAIEMERGKYPTDTL